MTNNARTVPRPGRTTLWPLPDGLLMDLTVTLTESQVALAQKRELVSYPALAPRKDLTPDGRKKGGLGPFVRNSIHDLLDSVLANAGFGQAQNGSAGGSPLSQLIRPNDTVVLKPNWVMHRNASGQGLACLVTDASVVAAVLDQVMLCSPKKIVVGDAPVQGCDLERLMQDGGYDLLKKHYTGLDTPVIWTDFRRTILDKSKPVWTRNSDLRSFEHYVLFDLGEKSLLEPISGGADRFRVTVYDPDLMRQRHAVGKHQYLVAREIIEANVVINLPKLKTHAKAGLTAALKNVVGINGNKEFLPHHRLGGNDRGGDCYPGGSRLKLTGERLLDSANRRSGTANLLFRQMSRASFRVARLLGEDRNMEGSWYGNDTIWRTCLDLNRILIYGCKDGTLAASPQRTVLTITDAVVCGEGEGPLSPTPKALGALTCAINPAAADYVHAHLMGFDWRRIPLVREAFKPFKHPLVSFDPGSIELLRDDRSVRQPWPDWNSAPFQSPAGWRGHCERVYSEC